ncbi:single-stranded DNA-binding protein [Gordonia sp. CPCC 205333]|uniref:single-stranded DNA-binding protein n=1 Tax=Gordonia sp. CPCC 205333 TaxID=3140790 RepID=UPI003AF3780E
MFETYTTVIGTVISDPRRRRTVAGEEVISFRVACNSRRHDKQNNVWSDGPTLYLTISCWRRLLAGVGLAIAKGRPIIAHGQIKTNEYVASDGTKRQDLEMSAASIGLDLSRCVVTYRGTPVHEPPSRPVVTVDEKPSPAAAADADRAEGVDQGTAA